jgi:hypothetical protein
VRLASTSGSLRRNNLMLLSELTHLTTLRRSSLEAGIFAAPVVALCFQGTASGNSVATVQYLAFGNEQEFWFAHKIEQELGSRRTDLRDTDVAISDTKRRGRRRLPEPIHSRNRQRTDLNSPPPVLDRHSQNVARSFYRWVLIAAIVQTPTCRGSKS